MRRVLVVCNEILLLAGVESLLARELDLDVCTIVLSERDDFITEIERSEPQVVVLGERLVLSRFSLLLELLNRFPELRVMVIDDEENILHIYDKHEVAVRQGTDLVSAIRRNEKLSWGETE